MSVESLYQSAFKRISPAWDLRDNVAVNPFFGLIDHHFLSALNVFQDATSAHLLPSNEHFKLLISEKKIEVKHIQSSLDKFNKTNHSSKLLNHDVSKILYFLSENEKKRSLQVFSFSDCYDQEFKTDYTNLITKEVSRWLSAYYDEGQAFWPMPLTNERLFKAWVHLVSFDQTFDHLGLKEILSLKSDDPSFWIRTLSSKMSDKYDLSNEALTQYYFRLLTSVLGWSSFIQKKEFEANRTGNFTEIDQKGGLVDLLAIRMIYDFCFFDKVIETNQFRSNLNLNLEVDEMMQAKYVCLMASELAYQEALVEKIKSGFKEFDFKAKTRAKSETESANNQVLEISENIQLKSIQRDGLNNIYKNSKNTRSEISAQMVFCIDVRSEVIRRHIENTSIDIQTLGFAGFFGLPISIKGLGYLQSDQQCPVLLNSAFEISESHENSSAILKRRYRKLNAIKLKKQIQSAGNSCFTFVESLGLTYIYKLVSSLAHRQKNINFETLGLIDKNSEPIIPDLSGLTLNQKQDLAFGALKNMGLTKGFAPIVAFLGHQSQSVNNPQASSLDCGACAGHSGISNARTLAGLLNDTDVRLLLEKNKNIQIPESTLFVSGMHITSLDEIVIDDYHCKTEEHKHRLNSLHQNLAVAKQLTRSERMAKLSDEILLSPSQTRHQLYHKAHDWSELRPEWGLAGNAAFVVSRREMQRGLSFEGRTFLHDYNFYQDPDLSILELIMTAPMVVAHWINMQYFASTVDPIKFGSGNKVLHNVVGTIGVIQGNMSDLQIGLSEQSVHKNGKYFHYPQRLQVFIEAPEEAIQKIVDKHTLVQNLIYNEWLSLISMDPETQKIKVLHDQRVMN